jgi:preprotein translocase subunit SecY
METIIIVIIAVSVIFVIFGFVYYSWCKNKIPLQSTEFSFDDVYHYEETRI